MGDLQQAQCPYCGETWDIDLAAPDMSDQDKLELTSNPVAVVVCADCLDVHLPD